MDSKTTDLIARIVHEANLAYCETIGDTSAVHWEHAPRWQKSSCRAGVEAVLSGKAKTPEEQHACWLQIKESEGWTYGPVKDPEKKQHPCMVPYEALPPAQQKKDAIFRSLVMALSAVLQ